MTRKPRFALLLGALFLLPGAVLAKQDCRSPAAVCEARSSGSLALIERGTPLHPWVTDRLIDVAEAEGIEHTISAVGRATGTDADAVHIAADGIPTAVVSVPLRYMHSSVETAQVDDILATARLLAAFAHELTADVDLLR